jgi:hypothetical protein
LFVCLLFLMSFLCRLLPVVRLVSSWLSLCVYVCVRQSPTNNDARAVMIPFTGLTTLAITLSGVVYINIADAMPAPPNPSGFPQPNAFVFRVGKLGFAQIFMNNQPAVIASDSVSGAVTLSWPAVTGSHWNNSASVYRSGLGIPPPRYAAAGDVDRLLRVGVRVGLSSLIIAHLVQAHVLLCPGSTFPRCFPAARSP